MRKSLAFALAAGMLGLAGISGCGEESGVREETQVTAPGGDTTTITKETTVETEGNNPPLTTPDTTTPSP
jgi:hypothetical protein